MPRRDASLPRDYALDPSLDFMRLLWSIEHGLQRTSKRMESTLGVTGPQRLVLRLVGEFPGLSAKDLASLLHLHPSTITGILQRLVAKGLLRRIEDPTDRRRVRLTITRRASRLTRDAPSTVESAIERVLVRTSPASLRRAREVLWEVAAALDDTQG